MYSVHLIPTRELTVSHARPVGVSVLHVAAKSK